MLIMNNKPLKGSKKNFPLNPYPPVNKPACLGVTLPERLPNTRGLS